MIDQCVDVLENLELLAMCVCGSVLCGFLKGWHFCLREKFKKESEKFRLNDAFPDHLNLVKHINNKLVPFPYNGGQGNGPWRL